MNKKLLFSLWYICIILAISAFDIRADISSCLTPVACPPCNPCKPRCIISGCFTVDTTGTVIGQQGNGFVVTLASPATPLIPGYPAAYIVTLASPFCSPLAVIAQQTVGGTIPVNQANLATGGSFTLNVTIPSAPLGFSGAPTNTVCFIGAPAV